MLENHEDVPAHLAALGLIRALDAIPLGERDVLEEADVADLFNRLQGWLDSDRPNEAEPEFPFDAVLRMGTSDYPHLQFLCWLTGASTVITTSS
jgi:hypothetical protein